MCYVIVGDDACSRCSIRPALSPHIGILIDRHSTHTADANTNPGTDADHTIECPTDHLASGDCHTHYTTDPDYCTDTYVDAHSLAN